MTKEEMEYNEPIYSQRDLDEKLSAARDREKAAIAAARLEAAELIHIAILKNGNMYTHDILAALWKDVLERGASTSTEKSQGAPGSLREGEGRTEG
jgi:hypothetical protein